MPERDAFAARYRISVFSDDRQFADEVSNSLGIVSAYKLTVLSVASFAGRQNRPEHAADLIILDVDHGQHLTNPQVFEARRMMSPSIPVVVVSGELRADLLREVVRLNAADWLRKPIDRRDLLNAISKCLQKDEQAGRVTAIVSAAGGSGASVIAMNAAFLAATRVRKQPRPHGCMLFELDFSSGSCGYFLDIGNDYDFKNVLENPGRIDTEFVDIIRKEHPAGFSLLSMKAPIVQTHPAGEETVLRILDVLTFQYEFVVVDVPYYETRWKSAVLEAVSEVVIVTDPVIPALRQARDLEQRLREIRSEASVTIVVNKQRRRLFSRDLSSREIARVFGGRQVEFLPDAKDLLMEAANRGIIPVALDPRSSYSRLLRKFLARYVS
jgi:pilus assembly protein CpaE